MFPNRNRERRKLAQMLEQRLPKAAHAAVFPPEFYWERFGQSAARVNHASGKNWTAALPLALEELERTREALVQQLKAITDQARAQVAPRPRASLREILADLEALDRYFQDPVHAAGDRAFLPLLEKVSGTGLSDDADPELRDKVVALHAARVQRDPEYAELLSAIPQSALLHEEH